MLRLPKTFFPPAGYTVCAEQINGLLRWSILRQHPRLELPAVFLPGVPTPEDFPKYFQETAAAQIKAMIGDQENLGEETP